jgi:hypothetical protein
MKLMQLAAVLIGMTFGAGAMSAVQVDSIVILEGTVKSVDWSGEQLIVVLHVNDGWDRPDWTVVGPKPADLLRMGWRKDLLKPDDRVSAYAHPDKSGELKATLKRFLLADGSTLEASLHSDLDVAPREALYRVFDNPADDPMSGFYANTRTCLAKGEHPAGQYNCTSWWNPDHTFSIFENNLHAEGGMGAGLIMHDGTWWLQMQRPGQWINCQLVPEATRPRCHSPVRPGKSGDKWSIEFTGRNANWTEFRTVEEGRH